MRTACELCGAPFSTSPSRVALGWGRWCSRACRAVAAAGGDVTAWLAARAIAEGDRACDHCAVTLIRATTPSRVILGFDRFCSSRCAGLAQEKVPVVERFLRLVLPEAMSGCWLWAGTCGPENGYGYFRLNDVPTTAHRASYELFVGPLPPGYYACHRCDVRPCVNPTHLFAGTAADNMQDCVEKGRHFTPFRRVTEVQS